MESCKVSTNGWTFDVEKLKQNLEIIKQQQGRLHSDALQGISLTSRTGEVLNGFEYTPRIMYPAIEIQDLNVEYPEIYFDLEQCKKDKVYHMLDYDTPTPALTGYFKEVYDFLVEKKCNPRRMRLSCLTPNKTIPLHSDGGGFKIHIPIISHPDVEFIIGNKTYYLEPGIAYCVDVGTSHTVYNGSNIDRWHLICDIYDVGANFDIGTITQAEFETEMNNASLWRNYVDSDNIVEPQMIKLGVAN